ncbi:MAG: hypothetical protein IKJ74_06070 [Clostridia bacterium]|nr:hypothetical protein [Clostridia bacterium]
MALPKNIFTGYFREGHIQGIAFDFQRRFVYCSFTTVLLKLDFEGNLLGSVENLLGHLGCIAYDPKRNRIYGSFELKHDGIGAEIMKRTGKTISEEDAFYLVSFDAAAICRVGMDGEQDGVMRAVYLRDVVEDYNGREKDGALHRYGCSGIDGISLGPVFGSFDPSIQKIMIAYGIFSDVEREDNDHQVLLQLDPSVVDAYAMPLNQKSLHHSGPEKAEARYFFFTGNTRYGIQNLEYDPATGYWFLAVYPGEKPQYENFRLFAIDGKIPPRMAPLKGRGGEEGALLSSASIGKAPEKYAPCGSHFRWGSTGLASVGDGTFYISKSGKLEEGRVRFSNLILHGFDPKNPGWFSSAEE